VLIVNSDYKSNQNFAAKVVIFGEQMARKDFFE